MKKFVQHDWCRVNNFNLAGCEMNNEDWKMFVQNTDNYPDLKSLCIGN